MRVVICDDHGMLLDAMTIALTGIGHDVVAVGTHPDQAVEACGTHRPDVCLLDVNFPDGSSVPSIPRIREASPETKVVMVSADSQNAVVARAIALGASGYIRKERLIRDVVEALDLAVNGHLAVEPAMLQSALQIGSSKDSPLWPLSFLTDREWQVLRCIVDGLSTQEIAAALGVRHSTARTHVQNVLAKLGVHSRLQASALISAHGSEVMWPAHVHL